MLTTGPAWSLHEAWDSTHLEFDRLVTSLDVRTWRVTTALGWTVAQHVDVLREFDRMPQAELRRAAPRAPRASALRAP